MSLRRVEQIGLRRRGGHDADRFAFILKDNPARFIELPQGVQRRGFRIATVLNPRNRVRRDADFSRDFTETDSQSCPRHPRLCIVHGYIFLLHGYIVLTDTELRPKLFCIDGTEINQP